MFHIQAAYKPVFYGDALIFDLNLQIIKENPTKDLTWRLLRETS